MPLRWFLHFYLVGSVINFCAAFVLWSVYINGSSPPLYLSLLDEYLHVQSTIDSSTALLLVVLMLFQNLRRLYECVCVSVFSDSRMNLFHYGAGLLLYASFHVAVVVEGPELKHYVDFKGRFNIAWWQTFGLGLFFWSSWQQHKIHQYLASLRKNKKGEVTHLAHMLPAGGWFELVSCPHYLMEVLVYVSMCWVTGFMHLTLLCVLAFVLTNQLVAAYLTHCWYRQHFTPYPKHRKALIPYLV